MGDGSVYEDAVGASKILDLTLQPRAYNLRVAPRNGVVLDNQFAIVSATDGCGSVVEFKSSTNRSPINAYEAILPGAQSFFVRDLDNASGIRAFFGEPESAKIT